MATACDKRTELILQQLAQLPTLSSVAVRVMEATGDDDASAADIVRLIESDPSLTSRILQLVHRSDVGARGEVTSIERAVVLLGFEAVRSAVLAVTVFQTFAPGSDPTEQAHFSREEFWKHCLAVACAAEMLARACRPDQKIDPTEAFVCGLLHDLGKVALDAILPKSFDRVVEASLLLRGNIADIERNVIGLDHLVVGKRLAERWQLPRSIRDCAWLHGSPPATLPATPSAPLVHLVSLADLIAREQHLGFSGNFQFNISAAALIEALELTEASVEQVRSSLVEQIEPRAKALGLGDAGAAELYQQALHQANQDLGRVSGQLAAKNRRLAIRAKFFDALSHFQGELRPDAAPQGVLRAIGQTASAVLDVACVAAFSILPGQDFAEVLLFDDAGDVFQTTVLDCPQRPREPGAGLGPVLSAGDELEWLLGQVSPRLSHDQRYWICLQCDGVCIGGVAWGAPSGESQRLSPQVREITAMAGGWSLALRTAQIREESRLLSEQLADANRQLHGAQAEILKSRTLVAVGEMAAGAGHEMNNPLAVISGRSQLLESQLTDPRLKAAAHLIHEQADRLSGIITELMHFAKPAAPKPIVADVADLVGRALHDAKMQLDPADTNIEVTIEDVPEVRVDVEQVCGALREVLNNAIQAATECKTEPPRVDVHAAHDSTTHRVAVVIADNGPGMDEPTLRRAFDPFFSSRPAGRRRGMGLAKAIRWIETSGGTIRLESRLGQGCRALVLLPAVNPPDATPLAAVARPERKTAQ